MAVSQQARQDAFLQIEDQGLHAITHDPGPRSPKLSGSKDFPTIDNWSPEITAKRRSLSGSNFSTSPNKPVDQSTKIRARDLEDEDVNADKIKTPKNATDGDSDIQISPENTADSKENKPFTDEGTILFNPTVVEENVEQKIGRADSPDKSGKFESNQQDNLGQSGEIQPLEGLTIQENKAVNPFSWDYSNN